MCSLSVFPPLPPGGAVTLCERNGELVSADASTNEYTQFIQDLAYPSVDVSRDLLRPSLSKESARSAFLEHDHTLRQRLLTAWYEGGFSGVLEELTESHKEMAGWVPFVASKLLALVRGANSLHGSVFPHLAMSNPDLVSEFSCTARWKESAVRCLRWHPQTDKFALALRDDSIKIYATQPGHIVRLLKHRLQKGVADLAWKPQSVSVLAVACHSGVVVWQVDPMSLATRPSTSCVQVLTQPGHTPVAQVEWCPQGSVLVSASPTDSAIMVWDVSRETCSILRRVGGGGVSLLKWSPDGSKLLTACPSRMFRVWECARWTYERWSNLQCRCQAACWSPDGSTLLFVTADEPNIYCLTFAQSTDGTGPLVGASKIAITCADVSEMEFETKEGHVRIGGSVLSMAWDPNGERLAVQFRDCSSEHIALFQTKLHPVLELLPCGFVQGLPGDSPSVMCFQPKFEQGSMLTVGWTSGRLSFVPLYYLARSVVQSSTFHLQDHLNGQVQRTELYTET